MIVAGIDGCPDGWVAAVLDIESGNLTFIGRPKFADLIESLGEAKAIGVDIPIGLVSTGYRQADVEAKSLLPGKQSSVFYAPHPAIRLETEFKNANEIAKIVTGKGISIQLFSILAKIAEVNDYLSPDLQGRIFEVHPEVSFAELNGSPVLSKKGEPQGFEERKKLLSDGIPDCDIPDRKPASKVVPGMRVGADDALDAVVAAWTAKRSVEGSASRIPAESEFGFRGLKAEIVY